MGDEQLLPLGTIAEVVSGATPSKARPEYWGGEIPWVSAKDMKTARLDDAEDHISQSGLANGSRLAPAGSTLVLTRGMTLLNDVPICLATRDLAFNQDVKAIIAKNVDPPYLSYALLAAKPQLLSMVELAGHGTGRLPTDQLKSILVRVPGPSEQRAIAHILGALDDKIELNRRMSGTLEAIARALFNSWFVDSVDEWAEGSFGELAEVVREQVDPRSHLERVFFHYSIPAFDDGQRPRVEQGETIKSIKFRVPAEAVLLSKLNPEVERVWFVGSLVESHAVCSTEFVVLRARPPASASYLYCLARSPLFRRQLEGLVTGTSKSHQRAHAASILNLTVPVPHDSAAARFERVVGPLLHRVVILRSQSETLASLRNTLLPKLISGELRVPIEVA